MPRTRTTPVASSTIHYDTIDFFGINLAYNSSLQISLPDTAFVYAVNHRDASGQPIDQVQVRIAWGDLPASVKTALKTIYQKVLQDAEAKTFIGSGTDANDLP